MLMMGSVLSLLFYYTALFSNTLSSPNHDVFEFDKKLLFLPN